MTELEILQQAGYKVLDDEALECQVTIYSGSVNFSTKTLANMDNPEYILVGIDENNKKFSVIKCGKDFPGARPFSTGRFTIANAKILFAQIMPEWNLDEFYYKLNGKFNESHTMAEFELTKATECKKRKQVKKVAAPQSTIADTSSESAPDTTTESTTSEEE